MFLQNPPNGLAGMVYQAPKKTETCSGEIQLAASTCQHVTIRHFGSGELTYQHVFVGFTWFHMVFAATNLLAPSPVVLVDFH